MHLRKADLDLTSPLYPRWSYPSNLAVAFEILSSSHGAQGILGKPSKQDLDNVFGTHVDTEVITQILQKGKEEASEAIRSGQWNSTNDAKGSQTIDTRGGRNTSGV